MFCARQKPRQQRDHKPRLWPGTAKRALLRYTRARRQNERTDRGMQQGPASKQNVRASCARQQKQSSAHRGMASGQGRQRGATAEPPVMNNTYSTGRRGAHEEARHAARAAHAQQDAGRDLDGQARPCRLPHAVCWRRLPHLLRRQLQAAHRARVVGLREAASRISPQLTAAHCLASARR